MASEWSRRRGTSPHKIASADVAALQGAVSDPANASTLVVLEPGVYRLSAPLRLQPNQFLKGRNQYVFRYGTPAPRSGGGYAAPENETILDCTNVAGPGCVAVAEGGVIDLTITGATSGALVHVAAFFF